jgi:hypothetical protein
VETYTLGEIASLIQVVSLGPLLLADGLGNISLHRDRLIWWLRMGDNAFICETTMTHNQVFGTYTLSAACRDAREWHQKLRGDPRTKCERCPSLQDRQRKPFEGSPCQWDWNGNATVEGIVCIVH